MIGHRGVGAEDESVSEETRWPENTIHAFQKAAELQLPMTELDVLPLRGSRDLAVYHNFNVKMMADDEKPARACGCPYQKIDLFDSKSVKNGSLILCVITVL